ncbi:MAG: acyl-CoA dehydrogenase family protein [Actinomycetales bacterium]
MKRTLFDSDHEDFRAVVREFVARTVTPNVEQWDSDRRIGRDVWEAAGAQGLLGLTSPAEYGGAGVNDYRYRIVVCEELARAGAAALSLGFGLQDDILAPYVVSLGDEEQKKRWLVPMSAGEYLMAVGMTEPGTGSDLRGVRTSATEVDGGWVVNGAKTFISSGIQADGVVTVVRTDPAGGSDAFTLLVIEEGMKGFERGRQLRKVGLPAQDTAELSFTDVFVPRENLLGTVGGGLRQLMKHLPTERLSIAAQAVASAKAGLEWTLEYTQQRQAFGKPIADFQHTRFELADLTCQMEVQQAYLDACALALNAGDLTAVDAAKAKYAASEMQGRVLDRCLQLFGGYGYMLEYPIARAFTDARVQRIYGGTNEIMREIIGRDLVGRR